MQKTKDLFITNIQKIELIEQTYVVIEIDGIGYELHFENDFSDETELNSILFFYEDILDQYNSKGYVSVNKNKYDGLIEYFIS